MEKQRKRENLIVTNDIKFKEEKWKKVGKRSEWGSGQTEGAGEMGEAGTGVGENKRRLEALQPISNCFQRVFFGGVKSPPSPPSLSTSHCAYFSFSCFSNVVLNIAI